MTQPAQSARVMDVPAISGGYFTADDWRMAHQAALDTADTAEIEWMEAREAAFEDFCHWQASARSWQEAERREFADFEDWCDTYRPAASKGRLA